jgi:hypothetical protein
LLLVIVASIPIFDRDAIGKLISITQLSGMDSGGKKTSYPVDFMKK